MYCYRLHHERYQSASCTSSHSSSDRERSEISSPLSSSRDDDADDDDLMSSDIAGSDDSDEEIDPGCHEDEADTHTTITSSLKHNTGLPPIGPPLVGPPPLTSTPSLTFNKIVADKDNRMDIPKLTAAKFLEHHHKQQELALSFGLSHLPVQNFLLNPAVLANTANLPSSLAKSFPPSKS